MKLFAGPCSLESKELCFEVARTIRDILPSDIDYYFKTSFAKENRSSSTSFMGHGIDYAKDVFAYLRADGFKIITDVHETWHLDLSDVVFLSTELGLVWEFDVRFESGGFHLCKI